jgi:hypothetical protein
LCVGGDLRAHFAQPMAVVRVLDFVLE